MVTPDIYHAALLPDSRDIKIMHGPLRPHKVQFAVRGAYFAASIMAAFRSMSAYCNTVSLR